MADGPPIPNPSFEVYGTPASPGNPPAATGVLFLTSVSGVDLKTTATTNILTVPSSYKYVLLDAWVIPTAVTALSVQAALNIIESSASGAMAASLNSGVSLATNNVLFFVRSPFTRATCAGGNNVQVTVSVGATATTCTVSIYILGHYI